MKTRLLILALIATIFSATASAQRLTTPKPVRFKVEKKQVNDNTFDVLFSATIDKGWHVYSPGLPAGGPVSASITIDKSEGAEAEGPLKAIGNERNVYDDMFGMNVRFSDETEDHVTVTAQINEMAMKQFAKSFAPDVMVLEPKKLREEIKEDIIRSAQVLSESDDED